MNSIPVIDVSTWRNGSEQERDSIATAVNEACTKWGFLLVSGHTVSPDLIDRMFAITYEFFDLTEQEKRLYDATGREGGRGYFSLGTKSLARTRGDANAPGDQKESFLTGAEAVPDDPYYSAKGADGHFAKNPWPDQPSDMQSVWLEYRHACQEVSNCVLSIFARALGMGDDWFESRIDKPISALVAHHYPEQKVSPSSGAIRSGAHTDFGSLTLLMTENRPGGLQVMGLDERWHDIVPLPGAFIVNIGDLMARWTNDIWRSTLHRVVNPPADAGPDARRLSIVYFHTPNYDAEVSCMETFLEKGHKAKYVPVLAGEHHLGKIMRTNSPEKTD